MTAAFGAFTTQVPAEVVSSDEPGPRTSQVAALAVYAPPATMIAASTQLPTLISRLATGALTPRTTQLPVLVLYSTGLPDSHRSRAWTFTLDGHTFYVLDLGAQGTFCYDIATGAWCEFGTQGLGPWNMVHGTMWGDRIVAGDRLYDYVWELHPDKTLDEDWRDVEHVVTGGLQVRGRKYMQQDALRVAASVGQLDEVNGATLALRFSDDNGQTWSDYFSVTLTEGDFSGEIAYRSLGSFAAPGRIFELSDSGGVIRIDGADAMINGWDTDTSEQ